MTLDRTDRELAKYIAEDIVERLEGTLDETFEFEFSNTQFEQTINKVQTLIVELLSDSKT